MSRFDPKASYDGLTKVTAGVHSSTAPITLPRNQLAWGVNLDCRTDFMRPRPGWQRHPLTFTANDDACISSADVQSRFEDNIFQGAIVFERFSQLVAMIGGHLFRIDPGTWTVTDLTPILTSCPDPLTYDENADDRYRAWFCEAESWVIAQDGVSIPWIYDGASTVRSDTLGLGGRVQVPIGKAMCYAQGRLIVSYASGRAFVIGDIVGGDSGTAPYDFKDSVLCFTENDVINGGGSFSVPINSGLITAFRPIAQIDTSMGQGPTQVFTTGAVFSLNLPTDRATWQTVNFPIGTVSNVANGATSDRCTSNVNGDIWFRAPDGVRAFLVARRDFQAAWINAPLSQEVSRALDGDDETLLGYASDAYFDNRLLQTTRPYRVWDHGIAHQGFVQLDFQPVATLSERNPLPTWLGNATGLRVLQVLNGNVNGVPRCFIFALTWDNKVELWEQTRRAVADNNGEAASPIEWAFETAAFSFTSAGGAGADPSALPGRDLWSLDGGRLFVDEIEGDVTFALQFRPDQDECWHDWHSWSVCAFDQTCAVGDTCLATPPNLRAQYRKPFFLPQPRAGCDPVTNKPYHIGREFQVRAVITGRCRVKMLELVAHAQEEDVSGVCAASESCVGVSCCPPNDYSYVIPPTLPTATGACCIDGACSITTERACSDAGGTYLGDDTTCAGDPCATPPPATGACCIAGNCSVMTEAACSDAGGTYSGDSTLCADVTCTIPESHGACCVGDACSIMTDADCLTAGGIYRGNANSCLSVLCDSNMPALPEWPVPTPYDCPDRNTFGVITITDPITHLPGQVGIAPGATDPNSYVAANGAPGCLASWCAAVWQQFKAGGQPYTQARFIWDFGLLTDANFMGTEVYPIQAGGYSTVVDLDTFVTVEYCPLE